MGSNNKNILHIITSTDVGGAELVLYQYLAHCQAERFTHQVLSLAPLGIVGEKIARLGIPVDSLQLPSGLAGALAFPHLSRIIQGQSISIVHCWMYHANLLGGLAARRAGIPSIWAIHHHDLDPALLKRNTILVARLGAKLSRALPQKIVYCAHSSRLEHERIGYDHTKGLVIPNGFDTRAFAPHPAQRRTARERFSIPPGALVVGHAGRFHPTKGHHDLLRAARLIRHELDNVVFLLCGAHVESSNSQLRAWVDELGLADSVILAGQQADMPAFYNALDVLVSSSLSESFPNAIGEAMSCGIPCIVTDVGDSSYLVGNTGLIVPPADPAQLAAATLRLLKDSSLRRGMGAAARRRILASFSIEGMTIEMDSLYAAILRKAGHA